MQVKLFSFFSFFQSKRFVAELSRVSEREYNSLFTIEQMRRIAKVNLD